MTRLNFQIIKKENCPVNWFTDIAGALFLAVQGKQASRSTTPTSTLKNAKSIQQVTGQPTESASEPTCSGVTTEATQTQMAPSANNVSSTADSANIDGQCYKGVMDTALAPVVGQTVDTEKPPADSATVYPTIMLPQQQKADDISEAKGTPSQSQVIITILAPTTEDDVKPETAASQSQHDESVSLPQFEDTLRISENSTNANMSTEPEMIGSSSTEQLISAASAQRIEEVRTIKRQPKGGWL
jgi:hypothetical protein